MKKHKTSFMKRWILAFSVCVGVTCTSNAESVEIDGLYYELSSATKTASVTYKSLPDNNASYVTGELTIPSTITYERVVYTVTTISEMAFRSYKELTSVVIPNSIISIEKEAFYDCVGLTSIELPQSINKIESYCFLVVRG